jgi:hypothetical protein
MIIKEILNEANAYKKVSDPRLKKMIALAVYQDATIPRAQLATLGKHPSDDDCVKLISDLMDKSLSRTRYGDVAKDGKYDQWLLKKYSDGAIDYEDLSGEGADALGAFKALSIRGLLKTQHQDINKFRTVRQLVSLITRGPYTSDLRRIQDEETIKQAKRDKQEIVLINDDRFYVGIPLNYGACYYFNNGEGIQASFCTGSSSRNWFTRYASDGPMIDVFDKNNPNETIGKWQIHAPTSQIKAADQNYRESIDSVFADVFPGLLKKICNAMLAKQDVIKELSAKAKDENNKDIVKGGYDVPNAVRQLAQKFPLSYNSKPKGEMKDASPEELNHLFGRENR